MNFSIIIAIQAFLLISIKSMSIDMSARGVSSPAPAVARLSNYASRHPRPIQHAKIPSPNQISQKTTTLSHLKASPPQTLEQQFQQVVQDRFISDDAVAIDKVDNDDESSFFDQLVDSNSFLRKIKQMFTREPVDVKESFTAKDKKMAAQALQYMMILKHIQQSTESPSLLDDKTGLCEKYELKHSYVSPDIRTKFAVYESDNVVVIAFKGTTSMQELAINSILWKANCDTDGKCGQVHSGFLHAFQKMLPEISTALSRVQKGKPIVLAGYSLGSALATLTAHQLALINQQQKPEDKIQIKALYSVAGPKVGDAGFVKTFDELMANEKTEVVRVALANNSLQPDLITRLPPSSLGYQHVGDQNNMYNLVLKCWNGQTFDCNLLERHSSWNYLRALARVAASKCGVLNGMDDILQAQYFPPLDRLGRSDRLNEALQYL